MSDPWTLSLLNESSSSPTWSRLDPPRFSSILAGACHFSRNKKEKNRYAKGFGFGFGFGFGITGEPVLCKPPTIHVFLLLTEYIRSSTLYYVLCTYIVAVNAFVWILAVLDVVMYFWYFLLNAAPNNLICLLPFLFFFYLPQYLRLKALLKISFN